VNSQSTPSPVGVISGSDWSCQGRRTMLDNTFPGQLTTSDGRISCKSSYSEIALDRICCEYDDSEHTVGRRNGACSIQLLCVHCGTNKTCYVDYVMKATVLQQSKLEEDTWLSFSSPHGEVLMLMPDVIVLDAVSLLRLSQRQSVVKGAGLSGPIRPLQGPICSQCKGLSKTARQAESSSHDNLLDDAFAESKRGRRVRSLLAPTMHKSTECKHTDFKNHQTELLERLAHLAISSLPPSQNDIADGRVAMSTECDCDMSVCGISHCENTTSMLLSKWEGSSNGEASSATSPSTRPSHVSLAFGKVCSSPAHGTTGEVDRSQTCVDDGFSEIYIVDTRHQEMCRPCEDGGILRGVMGQYFYHRGGDVCKRRCGDSNVDPNTAAKKTVILEPPLASCFVCSTPLQVVRSLDMQVDHQAKEYSDTRHSIYSGNGRTDFNENKNLYLQSHHNWVHSACTLTCERNLPGVCQKHCPRLNTLVSTDVDGSPRFENVCAACMRIGTAPASLNLAQASTTQKSCMKTSFAGRHSAVNAPIQKAKTFSSLSYPPKNKNNPTNKTTTSKVNWLTDASSMRKRAAANVTFANLSKKERDSRTAFTFPVDKSGVYTDKVRGTWYCLDVDGKNPTPVCGMPYWDPYFNEKRVWETMDQRDKAISRQEEDEQMLLP